MKETAPSARRGVRGILLLCLCLSSALPGCDSASRYKVLSTVFDGVPRLPPREEYCSDYATSVVLVKAPSADPSGESAGEKPKSGSQHPPFVEKRCNDCHDFDKTGGLILPKRELCLSCHDDFIKGAMVHGPVAVGDCLACHHPHASPNPALLLEDKAVLCARCHQERRLAERMHGKVGEKGIACSDCHNPHFGDVEYFLD